jgi:hypothetical protein
MRVTTRPRGLALIAAAGALAAVVAGSAAAGEPRVASAASPVFLKVVRTSQQAILSSGRLAARVRVSRPGRLLVIPRARPSASGGAVRIGKARRFRFGRARSRLFRFPLNASGRSLLASCGARSLVFVALLKTAAPASSATLVRRKASRPLRIDRPGCAAGGGGGGGGGGEPDPTPQPYTGDPIETADAERCDFLDAAVCLQPWPNDYFTVEDGSTDTGRLVDLDLLSMPRNGANVPINPADYNRNDGFSPGQMIVTKVPGLETPAAFDATGAVSIDHPELYDDPDQPVVVINADTGERHPVFAELDANPTDPLRPNPGTTDDVNLLIRPLVNFDEGARYVVGLRDLRGAGGATIEPSDAFRAYRDRLITEQAEVESRRDHMEELFATLKASGIRRSNLYLAWDFTVASERNLSERALAIRDDAFEQLGDTDLDDLQVEPGSSSPAFTITDSTDFSVAEDSRIAREVVGTVTVPSYLDAPGCPPGSRFLLAPGSNLPTSIPGNTMSAGFTCEIPRSAIDDAPNPARPSLYGHGLLGSASEVGGGNIKAMASEHNMVFCATDWAGFATTDVPTVLTALQDLSNFPRLVDRMQQGFVNFMYLGRAMIHEDGFGSDPAFQAAGQSLIDDARLFYDGNSQGGIMGGAYTALSVDSNRSVLGVPGMNYSTLLSRSVDFEPYAEGQFTSEVCGLFPAPLDDVCNLAPGDTPLGLYDNYPNQLERPLIFSMIQMVWDRGEANGYAHHMTTDPLPNTPPHNVLLHPAFGDHQVANLAAEVEARTIGARAYQPALDPSRHWESDPFFQIPEIPVLPWGGSAIVYWDGGPLGFPGGTGTPPNGNIPPRPGPAPMFGDDPHSYPRNDVKARAQKSEFLRIGGLVENFCTTDSMLGTPVLTGTPIPCYAHGWAGP